MRGKVVGREELAPYFVIWGMEAQVNATHKGREHLHRAVSIKTTSAHVFALSFAHRVWKKRGAACPASPASGSPILFYC